jgi:hypothetical protein
MQSSAILVSLFALSVSAMPTGPAAGDINASGTAISGVIVIGVPAAGNKPGM